MSCSIYAKKRKQHYVWKYYLKSWALNGKIYCLRNNKLFETNLEKIAHIRDFYRIEKLTDSDIEVIKQFYFKHMNPEYIKLNISWISIFNKIFEMKEIFENNGIKRGNVDKEFDILINNALEEFHSMIESDSISLLQSLQKGDVSFIEEDDLYSKFMFFLSLQYFRTRKRLEAMYSTNAASIYPQLKKTWHIVSIILATSMAFTFFLHKEKFYVYLLKNANNCFITGDQPIINTFANYNTTKLLNDDEFEFYYPINPKFALIISMQKKYDQKGKINLSDNEIMKYNKTQING